MARQRLKAPDRRRQIMAVAQRLFAQRGYSMTTTASIAAAAGVTEPILYRHFASKRDLFLQLLEAISQQAIARLHAIAGESDDPLAQLQRIITSYPDLSQQFAEPFAMIDRSLASIGGTRSRADRNVPDVRPLLAEHYRAYEVLVRDIIARGQQRGQLRDDIDPRVGAWHLIHAALGWRLTHTLAPELLDGKLFVPQSAQLLLAGLAK